MRAPLTHPTAASAEPARRSSDCALLCKKLQSCYLGYADAKQWDYRGVSGSAAGRIGPLAFHAGRAVVAAIMMRVRFVTAIIGGIACVQSPVSAQVQAPVAIVEDVESQSAGVEFLHYVSVGKVIRLAPS